MVALLCSHGADLDLQCQTALEKSDESNHYLRPVEGAMMGGHSEVVKYLIGRGAEFDLDEWKAVPEIWEHLEKNASLLEWIKQHA